MSVIYKHQTHARLRPGARRIDTLVVDIRKARLHDARWPRGRRRRPKIGLLCPWLKRRSKVNLTTLPERELREVHQKAFEPVQTEFIQTPAELSERMALAARERLV